MRTKWFVFCLIVVLTACQAGRSTPFPEEYSEKINLGDYELSLTCAGKGEPTLIFENPVGDLTWSPSTPDRFKGVSRTCIYQKYYIFSIDERKLSSARTMLDQVKDLHNLLKKAGVPGPYILVGAGTAASNILLYTKQYPKEVVGLVCVDCVAPGFWRTLFEKLETSQIDFPASDIENVNYYKNYNEDYTQNEEGLDIASSYKLAEKVTDLGDRPFVVLNSEPTDPAYADVSTAFWDSIWYPMSQDMCNLSSRCRFENVSGASEMTIIDHDSVDAAVKEVYEAVKE